MQELQQLYNEQVSNPPPPPAKSEYGNMFEFWVGWEKVLKHELFTAKPRKSVDQPV